VAIIDAGKQSWTPKPGVEAEAMTDYVLFASGGNDSVALCWYASTSQEFKDKSVAVCYSNTGWAASWWPARMERFTSWVRSLGFDFHETQSEGMEHLVHRKKGWPANRPKFCTFDLKIAPALEWLNEIDPEKHAVCCVGVRREESASRRDWPLWLDSSEMHGGRELYSPLVQVGEAERDAMIRAAGWEVLPHRSKECSPCVNANRETFRTLDQVDIDKVRRIEADTGLTMFRPHRFHGAKGIDEVLRWAWSDRGQYNREQSELFGCDSGMCGG
jgi:3'-phosphoadenosine 5'-phosphosulfate sulfotransferase (PAPS reductase)/FAD synthetase